MSDHSSLFAELTAHDEMSLRLAGFTDRIFVSDWNGDHPFVGELLGDFGHRSVREMGSMTTYSHLDEDPILAERLGVLHRDRYAESQSESVAFVPGAGATAFLFTLLQRQHMLGVRRLLYLPPVYYNAIWWIRALGWDVHQVLRNVDFARQDAGLPEMPAGRSLLWLTDPVWFAGRPVRADTIASIGEWQARTGSTVIVDGTFQYMRHDGAPLERSSQLDPALTYRLVCPTKALGLHSFRFAYAIVPKADQAEFAELHSRSHGAAGLVDRAFAHHAVTVLADPERSALLPRFSEQRVEALRQADVFDELIVPEAGYFVFGRPTRAERMVGMDQRCFGAHGMPGYLRFNVLSEPAIKALMRQHQET